MKSENKQRAVALRLDDAALSKCVGGATAAYATYATTTVSTSQTTIATPRISAGSLIGSVSMPL